MLAEMLREGAERLGDRFRAAQATWLEAQQRPDGGFPGRDGPSDAYYTDFALRALDLIAPDSPAFARAAAWLASDRPVPGDLVGAFAELSCRRTLSARGLAVRLDEELLTGVIAVQALDDGGFAAVGSRELSAYAGFLGAICREMLGEPADVARAADAVRPLRRADGGFAERAREARAQTSATAAAVALLVMAGGPTTDEAEGVARFLAEMQAPDGGLRAHADALEGDLLSTFTGLLTLLAVTDQPPIDVPALARFVRTVARPGGGFGACPTDTGADVEYAYYGIATLALLRTMAGER